jgi:hypothetical protein
MPFAVVSAAADFQGASEALISESSWVDPPRRRKNGQLANGQWVAM